jgi:uncharacterized membrane protein
MSSPASVAKHPIHPMLVVFPIGLWTFSLVCDVAYVTGWGGPIWNDMAFYTMAGGIAGGLLAAVPGFIDYLSLSGRVRALALTHMLINLGIVGLYALNLFLRLGSAPGAVLPIALSSLGMVLLGVSGWLGGELVYVHHIGVEPQSESKVQRRKAA